MSWLVETLELVGNVFMHARRLVAAALLLLLLIHPVQAETYYFHNDHLGTPQVVTDMNQEVVWKGEYDPFGKVTETVALVEQNLRFPGQYFDVETGLHYNYFRSYDPGTGRYVESDPIGLGGGLSTYGYGAVNPLMYTDPYGLFFEAKDLPSLANWFVDASAGFGDVVTFGIGKQIRKVAGIGGVNYCSDAYSRGGWAGTIASAATGYAAGTKAVATASSKLGREFGSPLVDYSHSMLSKKELKSIGTPFAKWLNKRGNRLNGDFVPRNLHWRMDPVYRRNFITDVERAAHVPFGNLRGMINRMPYFPGAVIYGSGSQVAAGVECSC